jgi:hypothetical protein
MRQGRIYHGHREATAANAARRVWLPTHRAATAQPLARTTQPLRGHHRPPPRGLLPRAKAVGTTTARRQDPRGAFDSGEITPPPPS